MNQSIGPGRGKPRQVRCGVRVHGVPDQIVVADLKGQLRRHVSPGWYACILFSDGRGACMGESDDVADPPEHVISWLAARAVDLNRMLHQGGHWIVAWSAAQEPVLIWRDGDGDIHTAVELGVKADAIDTHDTARVLDNAARALVETQERERWLELGSGQQHKLAQKIAASLH